MKDKTPKRKMQGRRPTVPGTRVAAHKGALCDVCFKWYNDKSQAEVNKHAH